MTSGLEDIAGAYTPKAGDYVASTLRRMIADGEFPPGAHLRQDILAFRLNTTRVPVREAFKTLVAEGVLQHQRNRGHYVVKLTPSELGEVCWLRNAFESKLVATVRMPQRFEVDSLRHANQRLEGTIGCATAIMNERDRAFHEALWNLSPNRLIAAEASRAWTRLQPYRSYMNYGPKVVTRMCREHSAIIDALESGDRGQANAAIVQHDSHIVDQIEDLAGRDDLDIFAR